MANNSDPGDLPDKSWLYGKFQRANDWQNNLQRKLAHKSLDIADDVELQVDNSRKNAGMGWRELAVIAAAGIGGAYLYNQSQTPPMQPPPSHQSPVDTDYDVRFWDGDGNEINIPQKQAAKPVQGD